MTTAKMARTRENSRTWVFVAATVTFVSLRMVVAFLMSHIVVVATNYRREERRTKKNELTVVATTNSVANEATTN